MEFIKDFFNELFSMFKPYYKYIRFFLVFILFFLSSLFQLIPISLFNIDINNASTLTRSLLLLFSEGITLIIIIVLYYKDIKKDILKFKKYKKDKLSIIYDHSFRYWLVGLIIMFVSNFIISKLGIGSASNDVKVINNLAASPLIFGSMTLIIKPIIEELIFRLSFKNVIKNKWLFIIISGVIFGAIHVVFSVNDIYQLLYLIPYCSLGIAFSYMYYESDNILVPISFHILHNTITAITTFLLAGAFVW
jgi:membrane protease YdiL (CAAX protease family)